MRLIKKSIFLLVLIGGSLDVASQQLKIRELNVGDTLPDLEVKDVINYSKSSIKISEFKDKYLILNFWATWCSPCIVSFPKLDS
ncbi:MAG: redoxin domain-containing protein, partial [Chitinophagaceae bacterium]